MDSQAERYSFASSLYYERPHYGTHEIDRVPPELEVEVDGYKRHVSDAWIEYTPCDLNLPEQGWKAHIGATPDNYLKTINLVSRFCFKKGFAFKSAPTLRSFIFACSKAASRESSGKLITIYLTSQKDLKVLVEELAPILRGKPGAYILSDLQIADSQLYVRYGAFKKMLCATTNGIVLPAIKTPKGDFEADPRLPIFRPPKWVKIPEVLQESVARRSDQEKEKFPYRVIDVLHYSNSGGVYLCSDESGQEFVVKEARTHAGLDAGLNDAVVRLKNEVNILEHLNTVCLDVRVPVVLEKFSIQCSEFAAFKRIQGHTFHQLAAERNPLLGDRVSDSQIQEYTIWVESILAQTRDMLGKIHDAGIIYGDLHPKNILIDEEGQVSFIDFETASFDVVNYEQRLAAAGFGAPKGLGGIDVDLYALERLLLWAYYPLVYMLDVAPTKYEKLVERIQHNYGLHLKLPLHSKISSITDIGKNADLKLKSESISNSLHRGLLNVHDPNRKDRLVPGNYRVFDSHPASFFYGSSGVIWALDKCGYEIPEEWIAWQRESYENRSFNSIGLESGVAGPIITETSLGSSRYIKRLLKCGLRLLNSTPLITIRHGVSALLVALARAAAYGVVDHDQIKSCALPLVEEIKKLVKLNSLARNKFTADFPLPTNVVPRNWGLMDGWTGVSVALNNWGKLFNDLECIDLARDSIERDIATLRVHPRFGTAGLDKGYKQDPYLESGSSGVFYAAKLIGYELESDMENSLKRACGSLLYTDCGMLAGLAGQMCALTYQGDNTSSLCLDRLVRDYQLYGVETPEGQATTFGAFAHKLSYDYGTGSAGYLLAVSYCQGSSTEFIPLGMPRF
ncbi:class III lanthionine synthetase LanKC [Devriesea agamarum]|uniref:class III lanthionine synthetase LanKC n=1 Tax=Devriesea agamarum TaxID=472569 RepID=UPI0018D32338|nr:class III lanthionine synthetase LanKC [Devriesea agamarum]